MIWTLDNPVSILVTTYLALTTTADYLVLRVYDRTRGTWRRHRRTGALPARWRRQLDTVLAAQLPARVVAWSYAAIGDTVAAFDGRPVQGGVAALDVLIAAALWWEWRQRRRHRRPRAHRAADVVVDAGHRLVVQPR